MSDLYCHVLAYSPLAVDGQPQALPQRTARVSNLHVLTRAELAALGWLPAVLEHAELPDADYRHAAQPSYELIEQPDGPAVRCVYTAVLMAPEELARTRRAAANADRDSDLAAGAPYAGHRIALDDASRADLSGMAATALAASTGFAPWPASYQQGWITMDNSRIPLPTPGDGLALAAAAGDYYASAVQRARDRKDAAVAQPQALRAGQGVR